MVKLYLSVCFFQGVSRTNNQGGSDIMDEFYPVTDQNLSRLLGGNGTRAGEARLEGRITKTVFLVITLSVHIVIVRICNCTYS